MGRMSVYSGPPMQAALDAVDQENKSGRLNTICERYMLLISDQLRRIDMSRAEWCAILDANNGVQIYTGAGDISATMLWANVHDTPGLGEKWGIDHTALVKKMQQYPQSALLAILEVCDRFWSRSQMDTDAALKASGVSIK